MTFVQTSDTRKNTNLTVLVVDDEIVNSDYYTAKDALLLGAEEYITKPFESFEVIQVINRLSWRGMNHEYQRIERNERETI